MQTLQGVDSVACGSIFPVYAGIRPPNMYPGLGKHPCLQVPDHCHDAKRSTPRSLSLYKGIVAMLRSREGSGCGRPWTELKIDMEPQTQPAVEESPWGGLMIGPPTRVGGGDQNGPWKCRTYLAHLSVARVAA